MPDDGQNLKRPKGLEFAQNFQAIMENPRACLSVDQIDIAALYFLKTELTAEEATSFEFNKLAALFESAMRMAQEGETNRRHAEAKVLALTEQGILQPTSRAGLDRRTSSYGLGPIGRELADMYAFPDDDEAARISAILGQIKTLIAIQINEVVSNGLGHLPEAKNNLAGALRWLTDSVERRQTHLDHHHELTRDHVRQLLQNRTSGEEDINRCISVMRRTSAIAEELKNVIMRDAPRVEDKITEMRDTAGEGADIVDGVLTQMSMSLTRIGMWADESFERWAAFHGRTIQFIEFLVDIDPKQVVTRNITAYTKWMADQVHHDEKGEPYLPYALKPASKRKFRRMGEFVEAERTKVLHVDPRPHGQRTAADEDLESARREIFIRIRDTLNDGEPVELHALLAPYVDLTPHRLSRLAAWVTNDMMLLGTADPLRTGLPERDMVAVRPGLIAETLRVVPRNKK